MLVEFRWREMSKVCQVQVEGAPHHLIENGLIASPWAFPQQIGSWIPRQVSFVGESTKLFSIRWHGASSPWTSQAWGISLHLNLTTYHSLALLTSHHLIEIILSGGRNGMLMRWHSAIFNQWNNLFLKFVIIIEGTTEKAYSCLEPVSKHSGTYNLSFSA